MSQLALLCGGAWVAWVVGLAPLVVVTGARATSGGPDTLVAAGSLTVLTAFVSVGYLAGCLLPRPWASAVAGAGTFLSVAISGTNGTPTAPVWPFGVVAGLAESTTVAVFRVIFFGAVMALAGTAAAWWLRERGLALTLSTALGLSVVLAPVAIVAQMANADSPSLVAQDTAAEPACNRSGSVTVCVHPARKVLLPELTAAVGRISAVLGPVPLPFTRVVDSALWPEEGPDVMVMNLQDDSDQWLDWAINDLAGRISGSDACPRGASSASQEAHTVALGVGMWLAGQAGASRWYTSTPEVTAIAEHLRSQPRERVVEVLRRSFSDIRGCSGSIAGLR